ncbi:MAG: RagB/SusD family nutrient uptake outer membrane protein, partial [Tannerella sp.]|nr:RagB/SusD family nutrient uptake outer membrane protein [Tannerella sp.]
MRQIYLAAVLLFSISSCSDMLESGSSRIVFEDEYRLDDPYNPFYAISGILSQLQAIGDRYVLLGELRGDLMQTTAVAPVSLQEINTFQVKADNEYARKSDYYAIINNCNYVLHRLDTSLVVGNEKLILRDYAEVKTIRAWTYFQLGLIFGEVAYITEPEIDLDAAQAQYPAIRLNDLVDTLIEDLKPYASLPPISASRTPDPFLSANLLLGDLYLYRNDYQEAAARYYSEIIHSRIVLSGNYINRWTNSTFESISLSHFSSYTGESLAQIRYSSDPKEYHSLLTRYSFYKEPFIVPAKNYVDFMNASGYFYSDNYNSPITGFREGDTRGQVVTKASRSGNAFLLLDAKSSSLPEGELYVIYKYCASSSNSNGDLLPEELLTDEGTPVYPASLSIYRNPHLYLRFAE